MAEHKNSYKGGHAGPRIGSEADEGITDKNKTRRKYKTSIPLQEYQSLARSTNLKNQKSGKGTNPRAGSRAPSEASDILSKTDTSLTRSCTPPNKPPTLVDKPKNLNPCKRRAMEEEDGLDLEPQSTSRPVTPSPTDPPEGNGANQTPKAKNRHQSMNPYNCPDMIDKDFLDIEEPQDDQMPIEDECMANCIRFKLEDILDELASAKGTLIWDKLDAANWARYMMNITNATRKDSMDKQTINNLVETNAYLTKRIVELEHTTSNIEPEMTQPQGPPPNKNQYQHLPS